MKNLFANLALTACLITTPLLPALAHEKESASQQSSPHAEKQVFDIQFLDSMIKHHEDGIMMFQMAEEKAKDSDIRMMAEKMTQDQKKEIPELQALRNEVKPDAPQAINMNMPGMMPMDMSKLKKTSGSEFDKEFLSMTVEHHKGAIKMADAALKKSQNVDVKSKPQMIYDKQKGEVAQMENMLKEMK